MKNVQGFPLSPCDCPVKYVLVLECWACWERNRYFLMPLPFVSPYYYGMILCGSKADKSSIWRIAIDELFAVAFVSLVVGHCEDVFMSMTADPSVFAHGFGVLVREAKRLDFWIDNLVFFPALCKTGPDPTWPMSRSVVGKKSTDPALSLKILSLCVTAVRGGDRLGKQTCARM